MIFLWDLLVIKLWYFSNSFWGEGKYAYIFHARRAWTGKFKVTRQLHWQWQWQYMYPLPIHIHAYVCACVYVYVYDYIYVYLCVYVSISVYVYIRICLCILICITYTWMYTYMYVSSTSKCICVRIIFICFYTCTCIPDICLTTCFRSLGQEGPQTLLRNLFFNFAWSIPTESRALCDRYKSNRPEIGLVNLASSTESANTSGLDREGSFSFLKIAGQGGGGESWFFALCTFSPSCIRKSKFQHPPTRWSMRGGFIFRTLTHGHGHGHGHGRGHGHEICIFATHPEGLICYIRTLVTCC